MRMYALRDKRDGKYYGHRKWQPAASTPVLRMRAPAVRWAVYRYGGEPSDWEVVEFICVEHIPGTPLPSFPIVSPK